MDVEYANSLIGVLTFGHDRKLYKQAFQEDSGNDKE